MKPKFRSADHLLPQPSFSSARQRILCVDSGCGGPAVLDRCQTLLPRERFTLVADRAGHPYGDGKSIDQVSQSLASACLPFLETGDYKALVIMCNTASHQEILARLYWEFGVPVFGMVRPGSRDLLVRRRREDKRPLRIGLMGTETLLRGGAWQASLRDDARLLGSPDPTIVELPCRGLASLIDEHSGRFHPDIDSCIKGCLDGMPSADVVVLARTHFSLPEIQRSIQETAGSGVSLYDPSNAVAESLWKWIQVHDLHTGLLGTEEPRLVCTGGGDGFEEKLQACWESLRTGKSLAGLVAA